MKKIYFLFCFLFWLNILAQDSISGSGLIPPTEKYIKSLPYAKLIPRGIDSLPEQVDLSNNLPVPGHQGKQGSCTAWTVGFGLKSYHERIELADQSITMSPSFVYNQVLKPLDNCKKGIHFNKALDFIKNIGIVELKDFKYDENNCKKKPSKKLMRKAKKYRIASWDLVFSKFEKKGFLSIDGVKAQLYEGNPVICGVWLDSAFWKDTYGDRTKNRFIWDKPKNDMNINKSYHAMLCVGYDDEIQAFKFLNSYGTGFGNGGFAWISYSAFKERTLEAYITLDEPNNKKLKPSTKYIKNKDFGITINEELHIDDNWLRLGYYDLFSDFKISLVYVSEDSSEVVFSLIDYSNEVENPISTFKLKADDVFEFMFQEKTYQIILKKIGMENISNTAVIYSFKEIIRL